MDQSTATAPGRQCPLDYQYSAQAVRECRPLVCDTAYVIGGLYGNVEALAWLLHRRAEEAAQGRRVTLFFNGDFNWFDIQAADFQYVNATVLSHAAIQGNVEAELGRQLSTAGCGCGYPNYVDDATVARSNAIMGALRTIAARFPKLRQALADLPRYAVLSIAGERVGVVHGDLSSLAGWQLAAEALAPADIELRRTLGAEAAPLTSQRTLTTGFQQAGVRVIASSHTCLPVAQDVRVDGRLHLVINNGAAGMPNFRGTTFGVITRLSADPEVPSASLYGMQIGKVRCDAIPIDYAQASWLRRFTAHWPPGSPAFERYYARLLEGPRFSIAQAARIGQSDAVSGGEPG